MKAVEAPWVITKSKPGDLLHQPGYPWLVKRVSSFCFATHAEALAFVLAQPEVRRRTSSAARALQGVAESFDPFARSVDL